MLTIDGHSLSIADVVAVARRRERVRLAPSARPGVDRAAALVRELVRRRVRAYGVTTGFGALRDRPIPQEDARTLQRNLVRSHAAGIGRPCTEDVVRAMMLLRANALLRGHSGARWEVVATLVAALNDDAYPFVPEQGSVGASGDLAPLSHLALFLVGDADARFLPRASRGRDLARDVRTAWRVEEFARLGGLPFERVARHERWSFHPLVLEAKEGLALLNGTQFMTAFAALSVTDAETLSASATLATAMTLEAKASVLDAFDERLHAARGQAFQEETAAEIRALCAGSEILEKPRAGAGADPGVVVARTRAAAAAAFPPLRRPVQDDYSVRCAAQVLAATRSAIAHVRSVVEVELNSSNDNPLLFPPSGRAGMSSKAYAASLAERSESDLASRVVSGGNFHGQPLALVLDYLAVAASEAASLVERQVASLVDEHHGNGLPAFLTARGGLQSGLMLLQYTAAALVSENKVLAHPASVDSIPTSANTEDHVSMGSIAARKAAAVVENAANVVAIGVLCADRAIGLRAPMTAGVGASLAREALTMGGVDRSDDDHPPSLDVERVRSVLDGGLASRVIARCAAGGASGRR